MTGISVATSIVRFHRITRDRSITGLIPMPCRCRSSSALALRRDGDRLIRSDGISVVRRIEAPAAHSWSVQSGTVNFQIGSDRECKAPEAGHCMTGSRRLLREVSDMMTIPDTWRGSVRCWALAAVAAVTLSAVAGQRAEASLINPGAMPLGKSASDGMAIEVRHGGGGHGGGFHGGGGFRGGGFQGVPWGWFPWSFQRRRSLSWRRQGVSRRQVSCRPAFPRRWIPLRTPAPFPSRLLLCASILL